MHYVIFGAGAVGSMLGARLALNGEDITFLARQGVADEYSSNGISLSGLGSTIRLDNPRIYTTPEEALNSVDVVLLAVKAYDVEAAGKSIHRLASSGTPVVCLTNGIGSEATLGSIIGSGNVIAASLTTAVHLRPGGEVRIERERGLGISGSHKDLSQIVAAFRNAGINTRKYAQPDRMKWSKLLINIIGNTSCAILGWTPDQIFSHPGLFHLEFAALAEALSVMRQNGLRPVNLPGVSVSLLPLATSFRGKLVAGLVGQVVARGRGNKRPSLFYDLGKGRSEIEWLNGAVVREGNRLGIATPANKLLWEIMDSLVTDSSKHSRFLDQPDELLMLASAAGVSGIQGYNAIGRDG